MPTDREERLTVMQQWARATWTPACRWTPGEVAWSTLTGPADPIVALLDGAMAWRNDDVVVILATCATGIAQALEWADGSDVEVCDGDVRLERALRGAGYGEALDRPFSVALHAPAGDVPRPVLASGYGLRGARDGDDLVGVHRASWRPPDLPFAEGRQPDFDPDAESTFTEATLAKVQRASPYRPDLHLVVEDASGSLVASCIIWLDELSGVASIEPLGVDARHRRRGLGEAMSRAALWEVGRLGGTDVVVHPRGDDDYPAARATYLKAGFALAGRTRTFTSTTR